MGYLYEQSTPDRFQQMCQSLVKDDFPALQCYPIGQPDGGRDGWDPDTKTVLQVKHRKVEEEETSEWMIQTLQLEKPKIEKLAKRGATSYVMITNARGTAHLDSGRIDKVQKWLDENLPIPAQCLWRDDIDRRLDTAAPSIKIKYSELLKLSDGIDVLVERIIGSENHTRSDALRAFTATQFENDRTVKFKQLSFSSDLLDLFVDVPIGKSTEIAKQARRHLPNIESSDITSALNRENSNFYMDESVRGSGTTTYTICDDETRSSVGAARFLISTGVQTQLSRVILEGAPGKGKSTLAQFVCQIHRARYLNRESSLRDYQDEFSATAFRLPIRVDLRDYASDLDGASPYAPERPSNSRHSLEQFLADLISAGSGGVEFKVHDLISTLKNIPILLFLDGLDEVPDLSTREQLITSIGSALARWQELEADVQVIVTSRPTIFGQAPDFLQHGFETLQLQNIDEQRILEYSEKWKQANRLEESDSADLTKILNEKLQLPHIRDLTRNPMQLTILLSLIHQVGHSLPDQRTDLYRRYLELFLTREADKSQQVRQHQPLLIGFIQHLAWELQREAEASSSSGSISAEDLQDRARSYLEERGHDPSIAQNLFTGGLERVFVLVERIEGMYEFEVQPLREFFCAQHLYSTAPVGTYLTKELHGDRAQRFEALAQNAFWLNVCRFYAGSCERAEMGTLVFSLEEMINNNEPGISIHARRVGFALLQDWVFSNTKHPQATLVKAIFDQFGANYISGSVLTNESLSLPIECGRHELRDHLFDMLMHMGSDEDASQISFLLKMNDGESLSDRFLNQLNDKSGLDRSVLLRRMINSGAIRGLEPEDVWGLLTWDSPDSNTIAHRASILVTHEPSIAEEIPKAIKCQIANVLDGILISHDIGSGKLGIFSSLFMPGFAANFAFGRLNRLDKARSHSVANSPDNPELVQIDRFFQDLLDRENFKMGSGLSLTPDADLSARVADTSRRIFGDRWATYSLAIQAAGNPKSPVPSKASHNLFDDTISICERARYGRLQRGAAKWWREQLRGCNSDDGLAFWACLAICWSKLDVLFELQPEIDEIVESFNDRQFTAAKNTIDMTFSEQQVRADRKHFPNIDLSRFSCRSSMLVARSFNLLFTEFVFSSSQVEYELVRDFIEWQTALRDSSIRPARKRTSDTLRFAKRLQHVRSRSKDLDRLRMKNLNSIKLSLSSARVVLEDPGLYPMELRYEAIQIVDQKLKVPTLAAVALKEDWLFE